MRDFEIRVGKTTRRRLLAWFLCFCMVLSTVDVTALATGVAKAAEEVATVVPDGLSDGVYTSSDLAPEEGVDFGFFRVSPENYYVSEGESVTFAVYAWSKSNEVTYTWKNNSGILAEGTDTYTIDAVTASDYDDHYICAVSDGNRTRTFSFDIFRKEGLKITVSGESELSYGETGTYVAETYDTTNSGEPITYQWYFWEDNEYVLVEGATAAEYSHDFTGNTDIKCEAKCGDMAATAVCTVTEKEFVSDYIPDMIVKYVEAGDDIELETTMDSAFTDDMQKHVTYVWKDDMTGEVVGTGKTLVLEDIQDSTSYMVEAYLSSTTVPLFTQWINVTVVAGGCSVSIINSGVNALGYSYGLYMDYVIADKYKGTESYQWSRWSGDTMDYIDIEGETASTLTFDSLQESDYGNYRCTLSYGEGQECMIDCALEPTRYALTQSLYWAELGDEQILEPNLFDTDDEGVTYEWYSSNGETGVLGTDRIFKVELTADNFSNQYYCVMKKGTSTYETNMSSTIGMMLDQAMIYDQYPVYRVDWNLQDAVVLSGEMTNATYQWYCYDSYGQRVDLECDESTYVVTEEDYKLDNIFNCEQEVYIDGMKVATYYHSIESAETLVIGDVSHMLAPVPVKNGEFAELKAPKVDSCYDITYQWFVMQYDEADGMSKDIALEGETNDTLLVGNISQCTHYGVRVSDGNKESQIFYYMVEPENKNDLNAWIDEYYWTYPGAENVTLSLQNVQEGYTYQWKKATVVDGETVYKDIDGATNQTYIIEKVTEDTFGDYQCVVSSGNESMTAMVSVCWSPRIVGDERLSDEPEYNVVSQLGESYSVAIEEYDESLGVTYQWYAYNDEDGWVELEGKTTNVLQQSIASYDDFGDKKCVLQYGEMEETIYVYVRGRDGLLLTAWLPSTREHYKTVTVPMDESYTMEVCFYNEGVDYDIVWKKCIGTDEHGNYVYELIENATGESLTLNVNELGDYSTYVCEITRNGYLWDEFEYHICGDAAVTGVDILFEDIEVLEGDLIRLTADVSPINAQNKRLVWTSDDESVAVVVNERGMIDAVGEGTATLTATTVEGGFVDTCTFTVVTEAGDPGEHEHMYGSPEAVVEGSCTEDRVERCYCMVAGCDEYIEDTISSPGHTWSDWKVETAASCAVNGKEVRTCTVDGCNGTESRPIAAPGHTWGDWKMTIAPTCTTAGREVRTCTVDGCGTQQGRDIAAKGHTPDNGTVTKVATRTENGAKEYHCTVCKALLRTEVIPMIVPDKDEVVQDKETKDKFTVTENENGTVEVEYTEPADKKDTKVEVPETITTPDGNVCKVTSVAEDAFKGNKSVKEVKIGENVTEIGKDAFNGCKNLTKVTIGGNVKEIGDGAFKNCSKVKNVKIPSSVEKVGDNAFSGCKSATSITIGKNVKEIGDNAFKNCSKVKKITIPAKTEKVGDNAFNGCKGATKITIGKNVKEIGDNAFKNCDKVTSITVPSKVEKLGKNAFDSCNKLKTLTIKSKNLNSDNVEKKAFAGVKKNTTIKVPKKKLNDYKKLFKKKGLNKKVKIKGV